MQPQLTHSSDAGATFLKVVTRPTNAAIELRAIQGGVVVGRCFARAPREIVRFLHDYAKSDVYFGVAARRADAVNGTLDSCQHLSSLFVDVDFKTVAQAIAEATLCDFILQPSAIVRSGGGLHVYWFLAEPFRLPEQADQAKSLLRRLAIKLGGDITAAECARVLRVPGTLNRKYAPARDVIVSATSSATYSREQFEDALADVVDHDGGCSARRTLGDTQPRKMISTPIRYADFARGLEHGQRDVLLFKLACSMRARGHNIHTVTSVVLDAASRCKPPFPERLAEAKVRSAWRYL